MWKEWKVRLKNPVFWIGLCGVIMTATGAKPEMFTSWGILAQTVKGIFANPFLLGTTILAVIGVCANPVAQEQKLSIEAVKQNQQKGEDDT